jgi:hypothetical protein
VNAAPTGPEAIHEMSTPEGGAVKFVHQSPNLRHDMFDSPTPHGDWLAGLIAADGCVSANGRSWSLSQSGGHGQRLVNEVAALLRYEAGVNVYQPPQGAESHSITVTSPRMVDMLVSRYGITPRKTVTLQWPSVAGDRAAAFLRGYIDGDGCVGVYRVGAVDAMLSVSLVGTTAFIAGAATVVPVPFRRYALTRCVDLVDARWNGRHAWTVGQWIYQHSTSLPMTMKSVRYAEYGMRIAGDPPAWVMRARRRQRVLDLLGSGIQPMRVAELTGEHFQTVYGWRAAPGEVVM